MEIKIFKNSTLIIGILINIFLVIAFIFLYRYSIPKNNEIDQLAEVTVPKIVDEKVQSEISGLHKVQGLPLNIDPEELGKQNPYNY